MGVPPRTASSARCTALGVARRPEQYGAAAAILLGDLLLSWADELLRTCGLGGEGAGGSGFFDLTRSEVVTGQFLDVSAQARGEATSTWP